MNRIHIIDKAKSGISIFALLLCQACSHPALPPYVDEAHAVPAQRFRFHDGGEAIYFSFDKSLQAAPSRIATYVFVVAGSGCTSMQYFLPQYFRGLEGESGSLRIFVLQKRFIEARTWGRVGGCSDAFTRADHPSRWIADQEEFMQAQLHRAQQAKEMPERVVVVGISEGGDIVPVLAQRVGAVTHAVILANGGMNPIEAYRLQLRRHGVNADAVQAALNQPPADEDAVDEKLGNRTWRYWSELERLKQTDNLLSLSIPILMAMGEADEAVPIASAWRAHDSFAAARKSNLTLLTYPNADHALNDGTGSHLPDFWHTLDLWLQSK